MTEQAKKSIKREFILAYPKQVLLDHLENLVAGGPDHAPDTPAILSKDYLHFGGKATLYKYVGDKENVWEAFFDVMSNLTDVAKFARREELETSQTDIHPIPYIAFQKNTDALYTYQRGKESGEGRLAGDDSIAPGGHVDLADAVSIPSYHIYLRDTYTMPWFMSNNQDADIGAMVGAVYREIDEEVDVNFPDTNEGEAFQNPPSCGLKFIGLLYDETDKVGLVHLGLIFKVELPSDATVTSKEAVIIDRGFFYPEDLLKKDADKEFKLESWSKALVHYFYEERVKKTTAA